jgi:hypothetical protein
MDIQLKIDRLSMLLPDKEIYYMDGEIVVYRGSYGYLYEVSTPIVEIADDMRILDCLFLLLNVQVGSEYDVLSKYYSIVNFKPIDYGLEEIDVLNQLIKTQKEKELLLEEVLRSKTNIDGLIENRLRSFIYYNTNKTN